jgi:hypothetical protein
MRGSQSAFCAADPSAEDAAGDHHFLEQGLDREAAAQGLERHHEFARACAPAALLGRERQAQQPHVGELLPILRAVTPWVGAVLSPLIVPVEVDYEPVDCVF